MVFSMTGEAGGFNDKRLAKRGLFFSRGWLSGAVARCGVLGMDEPRSLVFADFLATQK